MKKDEKKEEKKEKTKVLIDRIIKIILIIIIIILLLHNCALMKKGNKKTPSGNINIIDIKCDDTECTNGGINPITGEDDTASDFNGKTHEKSKSNSSKKQHSSKESSKDSSHDSKEEFVVYDQEKKWKKSSEINIFTNSVYSYGDKIAPEDSNTYQFVVKNSTKYNIKYSLSFSEKNPYHINLKYRLKKNNRYIIKDYVDYDQLNIDDLLLNSNKNDTFYLDWKWVSSNHDTKAGKVEADYKLKINVEAVSVNE